MVIDTARLTNQGNSGGDLRLVKRCRLTCWSRGFSTAQLSGGAINSAIGLSIEASAYIHNDGGSLLALGNLELEAPRIENRAMFLPAIASPPGGHAQLLRRSQGDLRHGALRRHNALLAGGIAADEPCTRAL